MDRASGRRIGVERIGRPGGEDPLRGRADQASQTREGLLSSYLPFDLPTNLPDADDRDDGLGAARGGMIAVLFGLLTWTLILFSVRRLLS